MKCNYEYVTSNILGFERKRHKVSLSSLTGSRQEMWGEVLLL